MEPTLISAEPVEAAGWLAASGIYAAVLVVFVVVGIIGLYRIFEKAHEPGWTAIIPIYNQYVILKITKRPWWWLVLLLLPVIGSITWLVMMYNLAKAFDKGTLFAIGLMLLPMIGFIILGFGSATYQGPPAAMQLDQSPGSGPYSPGPG